MKGGELCKTTIDLPSVPKFETYRWGGNFMFGSCGFFVQMTSNEEINRDIFITVDESGNATKVETQGSALNEEKKSTSYDDKIKIAGTTGGLKVILEKLGYPRIIGQEGKDGAENVVVEKGGYHFDEPAGASTTEKEDAAADTTVESENSEHQFYELSALVGTDKEGSIDVLKFHGPVKMNAAPQQNTSQINLDDGEILNKESLARVLCRPILEKLGTAKETKEMFNLSDNSRKLKEMKIEEKSIVENRGTKHLQAKKDALKASLDGLLEHKKRITTFTKSESKNKFGFERLEDSQFQDSIKNYETIKTNLENSTPVLQDLPDPLPVQIYKMINGGDAPIVLYENKNVPKLEGDALYKFCDAIQRKVDGLNNVLNKVHHFKQDVEGNFMVAENVTLAFDTKTLPLSESVLNEKERKKYYFNASSLKGFGKISDLSVKERASDLARNTSILGRKLRQGVENTSIQGIGKGIGKAASKGVGKAKGFMSYFTNTKKKLDGPAPAAAAVEAPTVGGKRKTRKNKARKTRRKVQRKRRQSKKH